MFKKKAKTDLEKYKLAKMFVGHQFGMIPPNIALTHKKDKENRSRVKIDLKKGIYDF